MPLQEPWTPDPCAFKISGTDPDNLIVCRRNGKYLILPLHESRQGEFTAALSLPEGTCRKLHSGKTYPGGQPHTVFPFLRENRPHCSMI